MDEFFYELTEDGQVVRDGDKDDDPDKMVEEIILYMNLYRLGAAAPSQPLN